MDPNNTNNIGMMTEMLRQRAGLGGSTAGFGAEATRTPDNPLAQAGVQAGAEGTPSTPTIKGMKQQKGEAQVLSDALVWRLKQLTKKGQ